MNTLILINALINKEETFKSFEEYFNDGNNYFVYSFEESLPDFQNFNFRNFKMANLIKIENIKIISDSKYLKINSKNFESGKFVFEKFSDEIMPAFYGYMIDNIAEINKFNNKDCISEKIRVINQIRSEEFEILPCDCIKYVDIDKENLKIELTDEIKNHFEILEKFDYFIFTSNKDLKIEKYKTEDVKVPNFIFYINDLSSLAEYIKYFKNKNILYLNQNEKLLFYSGVPYASNTFYQIEQISSFGIGSISVNNSFNHKLSNFVFSSSSISESDLSKFHYESLYNDIRINNFSCKAQTFIGSLMVLPEELEPEQEQEQEEDGKI